MANKVIIDYLCIFLRLINKVTANRTCMKVVGMDLILTNTLSKKRKVFKPSKYALTSLF